MLLQQPRKCSVWLLVFLSIKAAEVDAENDALCV